MNSLWDILAVAIGISFIFMILSILNSWIQEYIATVFNMRAKNLADIMQNLLEPGSLKLNGYEKAKAPPENLVYEAGSEEKLAAYAERIDLPFEDPVIAAEEVARKTAVNQSSMLQDVLRGAPTEIDAICGTVVRVAEKHRLGGRIEEHDMLFGIECDDGVHG